MLVSHRNGAAFGLAVALLVTVTISCSSRGVSNRPPAGASTAFPLQPPPSENGDAKFEAGLRDRLAAAAPTKRFVVLVELTEQLDLEAWTRILRERGLRKSDRRREVIAALEAVASRQQASLRSFLDERIGAGSLDYARAVAIRNRLVVEGSASGILEIAQRSEVGAILADWTSERRAVGRGEEATPAGKPLPSRFTSWAIDAIGARSLWSEGLDGRGVVVASIDSGVFEAHEQLRGRRLPGERGWFDPIEGSEQAKDSHGHGTSVLSQAVGGNPDGKVVGVAPGAAWASALANWRNFYTRSRMTLAADWVLRAARPDVVVNAWSHDEGPCTRFDLPFVDAWKAAEIFVVFPAGNAGPGPSSGESPAQLAGVLPGGVPVFSVAGLEPGLRVHRDSSRGPSRCGSPAFPTLAAPGADLPFAFPGSPSNYGAGHGTSLAAGLVGGAAALLLQADPELSPSELEVLLVETSRDILPPGRDDATGSGMIDLPAALALLRERRHSGPRSAP